MKTINKSITNLTLFLIVFGLTLLNIVYFWSKDSLNVTLPSSLLNNTYSESASSSSNNVKIFCMVLTTKNSLKTRALNMYKLWVNDCDDHAFISLIPHKTISTNTTSGPLSHTSLQRKIELTDDFNILQPPGFEVDSYNNLTHKMYLSLKYLYENKKDFDWILKADDDTLVFVDNLRRYVSNKNPQDAITFGHLFKHGYNSGGAGYLFSKEAFNRIGSKLAENYSFCPNSGIEDVDIASCFRLLNVSLNPALDEMGRETFHPLDIDRHFNGKFDGIYEWFVSSATIPLQKGFNCCSEYSISFHYMREKETQKLLDLFSNDTKKISNFHELVEKLGYV